MKLISWNVQWFCGIDGRVDVARVVASARALADFDVLCLQEVAVNYPRLRGGAAHDQVALLRDALPGYEVCYGAAVDERAPDGSGRRRFGNVVASRLPVLQLQRQALPWPAAAGVPSMPRLALCATVRAPWGALRVTSTHLEYYAQAMRLAQVDALRALHAQALALAATPPLPDDDGGPFAAKPHTADAVLCGDFNCDPASSEHAALVAPVGGATLHDAWQLLHGTRPQPPTFRVHDPDDGGGPVAFDFVFVSESLRARVRHVEVDGATQASDHQPVLVELAD